MMTTTENRVTGKYSALVDGKPSGLAGCSLAGSCPLAADCLRASPRLAIYLEPKAGTPIHGSPGCRYIIPTTSTASTETNGEG